MAQDGIEKVKLVYEVYYRMHREIINDSYPSMDDEKINWHAGSISGMKCILTDCDILTENDIKNIEESVDKQLKSGDNPQ